MLVLYCRREVKCIIVEKTDVRGRAAMTKFGLASLLLGILRHTLRALTAGTTAKERQLTRCSFQRLVNYPVWRFQAQTSKDVRKKL